MAMAICPICGRGIRVMDNNKNAILMDGQYCHKRCPVPKTPPEEQQALKSLKDRITFHIVYNNRNETAMVKGFNWANINNKIKQLREEGFTYADMEYALDEVVKQQEGFWGFGSVVNNIRPIMERKRKQEQLATKTVETVEFQYKPSKNKYPGGLI